MTGFRHMYPDATVSRLSLDQISVGRGYESVRVEALRRVATARRERRVRIDDVTLVFENSHTIASALEETLRAERITGSTAAAAELAFFNTLLPGDGELCACVYVDVADQAELSNRLAELPNIERSVFLDIGGSRADAIAAEPESEAGESPAAVCFVRFALTRAQREGLAAGAEVGVGIDHPGCRGRVVLGDAQRSALAADLTAGPSS